LVVCPSSDFRAEIFTGKDLNEVPTHTIHYGHIVDEKIPIDEVLITVIRLLF